VNKNKRTKLQGDRLSASSDWLGVKIVCEHSALISQMSSLVDALDNAPKVIQLFVQRLLRRGKLATVHSYRNPAIGAVNLRVVFEPSDLLRELVLALRAMNCDLSIVENHNRAMTPNRKAEAQPLTSG
jgi:hypothetical protein